MSTVVSMIILMEIDINDRESVFCSCGYHCYYFQMFFENLDLICNSTFLKVPRMDKRVIAVAKLGFKRCIVAKTTEKSIMALNLEMEILGCKNLKEVINAVFVRV